MLSILLYLEFCAMCMLSREDLLLVSLNGFQAGEEEGGQAGSIAD